MVGSLLVAIHLSHLVSGSVKPKPVPVIWFTQGALSATAIGDIDNRNTFHFYAVKGEFLVVNILPITKNLATSGTVRYPSGSQTGSHGGIIDSETLTQGGLFTVSVGINLMADSVKHGKFKVEVVRIPAGLTEAARSS